MKDYIRYLINKIIQYIILFTWSFVVISGITLLTTDMSGIECNVTDIETRVDSYKYSSYVVKMHNVKYGDLQFEHTCYNGEQNPYKIGDTVKLNHKSYFKYVELFDGDVSLILSVSSGLFILIYFIQWSIDPTDFFDLKTLSYKEFLDKHNY